MGLIGGLGFQGQGSLVRDKGLEGLGQEFGLGTWSGLRGRVWVGDWSKGKGPVGLGLERLG